MINIFGTTTSDSGFDIIDLKNQEIFFKQEYVLIEPLSSEVTVLLKEKKYLLKSNDSQISSRS